MPLGNYQFFLGKNAMKLSLYIKLLPHDQVYFIINKITFPSAEWPTTFKASDVTTRVIGKSYRKINLLLRRDLVFPNTPVSCYRWRSLSTSFGILERLFVL